VLAKAGWTVRLIGRSDASLARAQERIRASLLEFVDAGLLESRNVAAVLARIMPHADIAHAAEAELIFEAVPEDMALKREIFAELDPIESADLGGLDTMYHFARFLQPHLDVSTEPPARIKTLVEAGHRGVATGLGVLEWGEGRGEHLMSRRRRELMRWLKADQSRNM
jgi:3-hydroxyacyl-CoA dehydrogenase